MPPKDRDRQTHTRQAEGQRPEVRRGRPPKYDWSAIRRAYIRGDAACTLETLSAETGAPSLDTLKKRSALEDWPDLRRQFVHQTDTKLQEIDADLKAEVQGRHARIGKAATMLGVRGMAHLNPEKMEAIDVARLLKIGSDLERKALGMEEVTVRLGRIRSPDDLDKLSEADLWQIAGMLPPDEDDDGL